MTVLVVLCVHNVPLFGVHIEC